MELFLSAPVIGLLYIIDRWRTKKRLAKMDAYKRIAYEEQKAIALEESRIW